MSRSYVSSKHLNSLVKSEKLMRVRHGLFVVASPGGEPIADKLLLASKTIKNGFLGFHSALEFSKLGFEERHVEKACRVSDLIRRISQEKKQMLCRYS